MASGEAINILGHVESTVYHRAGREWISLDGKEIGVYEYLPGTSQIPLKVVQRNEIYQTVQSVPTIGVYSGTDIMQRISHDISVFWTKISSVIDAIKYTTEIDVNMLLELSDMVIELAHTCGNEIEREQSKSRESLLEAESSKIEINKLNQQLIARSSKVAELEKQSYSFSKALKCCYHASKDSPPLLHRLCHDKSVSVTQIVKELELDIHQKAKDWAPEYADSTASNVGICTPIEVASYCGNASVMQELYQLDPSVAKASRVLAHSAHGSLQCFELCKSWRKPSSRSLNVVRLFRTRSNILTMAAEGGNSNLLRSLIPSPQSFSVSIYAGFWQELVLGACIGGDPASLDWLMEFDGSKSLLTEDVCRNTLLFSDSYKFGLPCVEWLVKHHFSPKLLFETKMDQFLHRLAKNGRIDILEWMSTLPGFKVAGPKDSGDTMFHSACRSKSNSLSVMKWALKYAPQDFDKLNRSGEHLVHVAALYGRLDCLKWICETFPAFQHVRGSRRLLSLTGSRKRTIIHYAAFSGSLPTMEWLYSVHGAEFKDLADDGWLPIHDAYSSVEMLTWMIDVGKCDLQARDGGGLQVLHYAVIQNQIDVVSYIVSKLGGMCLNTPIPECGLTAAHFVETQKMGECLLKFGANSADLLTQRPELRPWLSSIGVSK